MTTDTIGLLDTIVGGPAHMVGWSDGGIVGLMVAIARPDLVRELVVVGDDDDTAALYRTIPNSELAVIPGASHAVAIESRTRVDQCALADPECWRWCTRTHWAICASRAQHARSDDIFLSLIQRCVAVASASTSTRSASRISHAGSLPLSSASSRWTWRRHRRSRGAGGPAHETCDARDRLRRLTSESRQSAGKGRGA